MTADLCYAFFFLVCVPIFIYGTATGWISPHKALLMSNDSPSGSPISEEEVSWMASIIFILAPIAVFIYGVATDKFGRKKTLLCVAIPMTVRKLISSWKIL